MSISGDLAAVFGIWDYVVFCIVLSISMGIGVFFAFKGNKNPEDFLMGGRQMSVLPVSISLLSSFISAVSILGYSGETYAHGLQLSVLLIGAPFGILLATTVFLPVFYPLKLTSVMEYIEMRFQSRMLRLTVLIMGSGTFLLYTGLCLYAPTLALASVTPISVDTYIVILGVVCTLYSTIGGLKAVVWTDTFQMIVIVAGVIAVAIVGTVNVGGVGNVVSIASAHGRTEMFNMNVNPYERHNFWNVFIMGTTVYFAMYGANQTNLQRACSVPTLNDARKVYLINLLGMVVTVSLVFYSGLCAFANYAGCDPISQGHIFTKDQILPYFVMDKVGSYGMPGLFVATLLSGALSSMSSVINSLVAMVWVDLEQKVTFFKNMSPTGAALTNKMLSIIIGVFMIGLAFLVKGFGGLFQAAFTIMGIMAGPCLGIFIMGLLFPKIGRKSAWCGIVFSMATMTWIIVNANKYNPKPTPLEFSTDKCPVSDDYILETTVSPTLNLEAMESKMLENSLNDSIVPFSKDLSHPLENLVQSVNDSSKIKSLPMTKTEEVEVTTLPDIEDEEEDINNWSMMYVYGISYTLYTPMGVFLTIIFSLIVVPFTGGQDMSEVRPELIAPIVRRFLPKNDSLKSKKLSVFNGTSYTPVKSDAKDIDVPSYSPVNFVRGDSKDINTVS